MGRLRGEEWNLITWTLPTARTSLLSPVARPRRETRIVAGLLSARLRRVWGARRHHSDAPALGLRPVTTRGAQGARQDGRRRRTALSRRRPDRRPLVLLRGLLGRRTTPTRRCVSCMEDGAAGAWAAGAKEGMPLELNLKLWQAAGSAWCTCVQTRVKKNEIGNVKLHIVGPATFTF
jgi:hypothetical protein